MAGSRRSWTLDEVRRWFAHQIPDHWFVEEIELASDRDEIRVTGVLDPGAAAAGEAASIAEFREATRDARVRVARHAEELWGRKVSWAVRCGDAHERFTSANVPVMTRLGLEERQVLDTLIEAGVARSRSDALGWCVRLVASNEQEWIDALREAMSEVEKVRRAGPAAST